MSARSGEALRRLEPWALWLVFLTIHAVQAHWNLTSDTNPFADVTVVYRGWTEQVRNGSVPGIDEPFVYPLLAILPMLATAAIVDAAGSHLSYGAAWMLLITAGHAAAFAGLAFARLDAPQAPGRRRAAWWWLAFLAVLGPVATGRIDAVAAPIAILALLLLRRHPAVCGALLAIGAWVKVWPAALLAALFVASRRRLRLFASASGTGLAVLLGALLLGAGANALSFVSGQTGRGLQVEAPAALVPMWHAALGTPGYRAGYDREILTVQVTGPGTEAIAFWTTPAMGFAVLLLVLLGLLRRRRGASFTSLAPVLSLGLVTVLVVSNKVGSPQFVTWIGATVAVGLVWSPRGFAVPAGLTLAIAAATCWIYPWNYPHIMTPTVLGVTVLTIRNLLELALFTWCLWVLLRPLLPTRTAFGS